MGVGSRLGDWRFPGKVSPEFPPCTKQPAIGVVAERSDLQIDGSHGFDLDVSSASLSIYVVLIGYTTRDPIAQHVHNLCGMRRGSELKTANFWSCLDNMVPG